MKKTILFFSVVVAAFLMTSCMGSGETSFQGTSLAYVKSTEGGTKYALTVDGVAIASEQINLKSSVRDFIIVTFSWSESLNTITQEGIYNVTVSSLSDPIDKMYLNYGDAPELETEVPIKAFSAYAYPTYSEYGSMFDHNWVFLYSYEKGTKKELEFYYNADDSSENGVYIDVRAIDTGETVSADQTNIPVAVDFETINDQFALDSGPKTIQVYFRYYGVNSAGATELITTSQISAIVTK